jgi:hypothetical protein
VDETTEWPAQMPVPSRGTHLSVDRGACVMEYAALLSGDRHTDHPVRVHPYLAAICRQVNDRVGDEARAELVRLVPALLGTGSGRGPGSDAGRGAVVEVLRRHLLRCGLPAEPPTSPPGRVDPPERIDPGVGGGTAVLDRPVETPALVARASLPAWTSRALGALLWREGRDDRAMVELLEEMVHEVRAAEGLPPVATSGPDRPSAPA